MRSVYKTITMNNTALADYEEATDRFIGALAGFSTDDFNTKRSDGGWSAGQVGQHMNLSHGLGELLRGETTNTDRDPAQMVAGLEEQFLDLENKMQSPGFVAPEDKIYGKQALIAELSEKFTDTKMAIRDLDLTETCTGFVLPETLPMTRLEWIYFLVYHTQRHTVQLKHLAGEMMG